MTSNNYKSGNFYLEPEIINETIEDIIIKFQNTNDLFCHSIISKYILNVYKPTIFKWSDLIIITNKIILNVGNINNKVEYIYLCILNCLKQIKWDSQYEKISILNFIKNGLYEYIKNSINIFERNILLDKIYDISNYTDPCFNNCVIYLKQYINKKLDINILIDISYELFTSKLKPDIYSIIRSLIYCVRNNKIINSITKYDLIKFINNNLTNIIHKFNRKTKLFNCV